MTDQQASTTRVPAARQNTLWQTAAWVALFLVMLLLFTVLIHSALGDTRIGADYFIYWVGGRAAILEQTNPYLPEVTERVQTGIYGRPALPGEDQVAFAYPLYTLPLLLPFVWLPFDWSQAAWMAFQMLALLAALLFAARRSSTGLALSTLLFYPVVFGLLLGNFGLLTLIVLLISLTLLLNRNRPLTRQNYFWLGAACVVATIKPQLTWFFLAFIALFALRKRAWSFFAGFAVVLAVLLILSLLAFPTWPSDWLNLLRGYTSYVPGQPPVEIYAGYLLSASALPAATIILGIPAGAFSLYLALRWWRGTLDALPLLAWGGWVTYFFHPSGLAYDQYALLLPLLLWVFRQASRRSLGFSLAWAGAILFSWVSFAVGKFVYHPADTWPLLLYTAWMIWLMVRPSRALIVEN